MLVASSGVFRSTTGPWGEPSRRLFVQATLLRRGLCQTWHQSCSYSRRRPDAVSRKRTSLPKLVVPTLSAHTQQLSTIQPACCLLSYFHLEPEVDTMFSVVFGLGIACWYFATRISRLSGSRVYLVLSIHDEEPACSKDPAELC